MEHQAKPHGQQKKGAPTDDQWPSLERWLQMFDQRPVLNPLSTNFKRIKVIEQMNNILT